MIYEHIKSRLSTASIILLIRNGKMQILKGNVPLSLVNDFADISRDNHIIKGTIKIYSAGDEVRFDFSDTIAEAARQRFRNVWFAYPERKITGI